MLIVLPAPDRRSPDRRDPATATRRAPTAARASRPTAARSSVATVAAARPPMTARPSGAVASAPSPRRERHRHHAGDHRGAGHQHGPHARLARRRWRVCSGEPPCATRLLGKRHQQNRVRDGDADGHDRAHERLHVQASCRVSREHQRPRPSARPARSTRRRTASRSDWKFAASSRKITTTATISPAVMFVNVSRIARDLAAHGDRRAARRRARARDRRVHAARRVGPDPRRRRSPSA